MPSRAPVLLVVCGYVLVAALALLAFLGLRSGASPSGWAFSLCLAPVVVYLLVSWRERSRTQFLAKSVACFGFLPVLTLMWALSQPDAAPPRAALSDAATADAPAAPQASSSLLDEARLFHGAQALQEVPVAQAAIERMRSGGFADGTELSLFRFAGEREAQTYLAFMRDTQQGSPAELGGRQGLRLNLAPDGYVYVELHGRQIVQVRARDEAEALARLLAQGVPAAGSALPASQPPSANAGSLSSAAAAAPAPVWPFATAYCVAHALSFVLFILWAGTRSTRVAAAAGAELISPARLRARLLSLGALEVPFFIGGETRDDALVATYHLDANNTRVLRVFLAIDPARREVRVRERIQASGAPPKDAHERSMRPAAGPYFDPSRPQAQKLSGRVAQSSIIEPQQLAAVPLPLEGDRELLPSDYARALDPERMLHLLCALVTRSGFHWQPGFFGR
jgi:hypothetical protein